MLRIYNTTSRSKEEFDIPGDRAVKIYTCGPTVYDYAHIGNLRTFVFNDILCRYLRYSGYETHQVMNITDVDDKTIAGAQTEGVSLGEYTRKYEEYFMQDLETLRVEDAWKYPRATEHIEQMIELVQSLVDRGHAYEREGSVYFDISSWDEYGKLSGTEVEESSSEFSRIDEDEYDREQVHDFVLWKAAKEDEPSWESPWGRGRPGWHIECSALGLHYLGPTLDIHTGAVDLIFPHHENEIAQAEAATGEPFCRYWVHPAHLIVDGMKMSKSLGNFYTLRDLLDQGYDPMAIRHQLLTAHYRHQLDFTLDGLDESKRAISRLWDFMDRLNDSAAAGEHNDQIDEAVQEAYEQFEGRMDDDLNVPGATGAVFTLMNTVNSFLVDGELDEDNVRAVNDFMEAADSVLGYIAHEREALDEEIEALIQEREEAREEGDYDRADEIRDELQDMDIVLEDTPEGTHWRRVE